MVRGGIPYEEDEPFELLQLLGTGGFAQTYKARVVDEHLLADFGDIVALKIPLGRAKERTLQRELEMNAFLHARLKDLQSANLVRYLGFCSFRNQIVMAMQYVPDGSLRKRMGTRDRPQSLQVDEAIDIAEGVAQGLVTIHREHVFHRDIKPENILMDGKIPKIADLGISRMLQTDQLASTHAGTLYYMSPETLTEDGSSFTSDIWSLGVTLYEMLTGRLPFGEPGAPPGRQMALICAARFTPASELRPELPAAVDALLERCLARDPGDRFGSAQEMVEGLRRLRDGKARETDPELDAARELVGGLEPSPDAERRLRELVARKPDEPRAHQYLGEYLNRCQRHGEAVAVFERGIARCPEDPLLHWDLALALQRQGRGDRAAEALRRAIAIGLDASLRRHAEMLLRVLESRP